jgi:hypothetical protein
MLLTAAAVVALAASTLPADNSFYRVLGSKPNATIADAMRAFFILALDADPKGLTVAEQAQALADMKVMRKEWADKPDEKLTRGRASYMICQVCGIKGGVTMLLIGPTERYCYRECVYLGMIAAGNQDAYVSGSELLGILAKAAEYIDGHKDRKVKPQGSAAAAVEKAKKTEGEAAPAAKPAETPKDSKPAEKPAATEKK